MAKITINGVTLDPATQGAALAATGLAAASAEDSDYILVQTRGPVPQDEVERLEALGVEFLEYVPESTYICRFPGDSLKAVRASPSVVWANVYLKGFKVAPRLRGSGAATADLLSPASLAAGPGEPALSVDVVFQRGVKAASQRKAVAKAAGVDPAVLDVGTDKIRVTVRRDRLDEIAKLDAVRHVEPVARMSIHNNVARGIVRAGPTVAGAGPFEGDGEIVAICDTGIDDAHPAFTGRIRRRFALGRPGTGPANPARTDDPHGHGTHVAGSAAGDGNSTSMGGAIRGTAPRAEIVMQSAYRSPEAVLGGLPADLARLFAPPYTEGARVHSNSWGSTDPTDHGIYESNARALDTFVWEHRDLVVVVAAGNDGVDRDQNGLVDAGSITPPATARNCISVGASESVRPAVATTYGTLRPTGLPKPPITSDRIANDAEGMAAFSSRGPTADTRLKPDIVAPGTSILSARSSLVLAPNPLWGASSDAKWMFDSGTSMATPLVAGACAAIRQFAKSRGVAAPSAALVKALVINGAHPLAGQYIPSEAGPAPSISQGFGRLDLAAAVGADGSSLEFRDEQSELQTGGAEERTVQVPAGATRLRVTLVWTDWPGETLQNDLDLAVIAAGGQERHGNAPVGGAQFDRVNNVEQVDWPAPPTGACRIRRPRIPRVPQAELCARDPRSLIPTPKEFTMRLSRSALVAMLASVWFVRAPEVAEADDISDAAPKDPLGKILEKLVSMEKEIQALREELRQAKATPIPSGIGALPGPATTTLPSGSGGSLFPLSGPHVAGAPAAGPTYRSVESKPNEVGTAQPLGIPLFGFGSGRAIGVDRSASEAAVADARTDVEYVIGADGKGRFVRSAEVNQIIESRGVQEYRTIVGTDPQYRRIPDVSRVDYLTSSGHSLASIEWEAEGQDDLPRFFLESATQAPQYFMGTSDGVEKRASNGQFAVVAPQGKFAVVGSSASNDDLRNLQAGRSNPLTKGFTTDAVLADNQFNVANVWGNIAAEYSPNPSLGDPEVRLRSASANYRVDRERFILKLGQYDIPFGLYSATGWESKWIWLTGNILEGRFLNGKLTSTGGNVFWRMSNRDDQDVFLTAGVYNATELAGFFRG